MIATASRTLQRTAGVVLAALVLGLVTIGLGAAPAHAAAQVSVSGNPNPDAQSEIALQGTGFQSVQGGFGGIYVLFGWVDDPNGGSWRPSQGGVTGANYRYVYDDETNPAGFQLFVTFPGSSTSYAANGGEVAADGTWSGTIRIPGAVFQTFDRDQNATTVDCREVQCGIITIGAHGVKNANNESFTPVTFAGAAAAQPQTAAPATEAAPAASETAAPAAAPAGTAATAATGNETQQTQGSSLAMLDWFLVLLPVFFVIGLSVVALAVGIGAYLAAKSLILGVNPEALEKVRGQRERRAIREREKQRRKTAALRLAQESRSARARQRVSGAAARRTLLDGPDAAPSTEPPSDRMIDFFRIETDAMREQNSPLLGPATPAGGVAAPATVAGGIDLEKHQDAPTVLVPTGASHDDEERS
ncbi:hypothetical protein F8O01_09185 [Pseudoclavibacter chungangensis]|uniref:Minor silk ampullate protein n=1 Tax=Pseudoclavibacter chungangensis TaxID=587635 RepID=A0A7J5BR94_9MICO|nr:hypothetical protein [Pseudoclavibacter chungangensis]KAB1656822.1 hypothetical protein F8O01_09185 [Pseudoclavibacter chungangensis]NYJ67273.1 hypothetical protein [Pseudoclavibacter chungangensis]